jgi:hypothetical protein
MASLVASVTSHDYWTDLDAVRSVVSRRGRGEHCGAARLRLGSVHGGALFCGFQLVLGLVGLVALRLEVVALVLVRDGVFESLGAPAEWFKTVLSIAKPSFSATVK